MSPVPHGPTHPLARGLLAGGLAALALLTLAERSSTRMFATPWIWMLAALVAAAPLSLLVRLSGAHGPMKLPSPPWLLAVGIAGLGPTLSALLSPHRGPSLFAAGIPLSAACLLLLVHDWLRGAEPDRCRQLGRLLAAGALLVASVSAAYWLRDVVDRLAAGRSLSSLFEMRNPHPLGHSNYTAGLMLLGLPWLAVPAWQERGWTRTAAAAGSLLCVLNLFTCGSRGGLLGLAALGIAGVVFARLNWRRVLLISAAALLITAVLAVANPRVRSLLGPADSAAAPNASSVQRGAMIQAGLLMGADRPLLGWGPGSTPLAYPRYRHALEGGAENVLQLHNTPLHLWAENGALGLLGAALITALGALHWRRSPVAAATLAGYGVFALTDFQLDVPVFAAAVAALAALLAAPSAATASPARLGTGLGVIAAAGAIVVFGLRDPTPAMNVEALRLARDPAQHARAVALFNESLALNPDQEIAHFNLGWLLVVPEPAKAEAHFRAAARLVPDKGGVYFGLGLARLNQGDRTGAARALALECVNEPRFLASPWWTVPEIGALRSDATGQFTRLLDQAYPRNLHIKTSWSEKQARLLLPLAPRLGLVSPGPELNYRRERIGYPVLMRNADLPVPADLYDVREDPRFPESVAFPLPPKGWLPSPHLLKLLDEAVPVRQ